jgi:hypothetical protein
MEEKIVVIRLHNQERGDAIFEDVDNIWDLVWMMQTPCRHDNPGDS